MDLKNKFRYEIKNKIGTYSPDVTAVKSDKILISLKKLLAPFSGLWAAFKPLKSEPQIDFASIQNINWAFPATQDSKLVFMKNVSNWSRSPVGVQEPQDGETVALPKFEGFIIPCLGMNTQGYRLGRGAGFYDKTFDTKLNQGLEKKYKIGVCFDDAVMQEIPHLAHDLFLDIGVTENKVYFFNSNVKNVFNI